MDSIIERMTLTSEKEILETDDPDIYEDIDSDDVVQQDTFRTAYDDPTKMTPYVLKYSNWKYLVLVLTSLQMFGNFYVMEQPAILIQQTYKIFQAGDEPFNYYTYGLIYAMTFAPNIIFPLLAGLFVDKYGIRPAFIVLQVMCMLGQLVLSVGAHQNYYDHGIVLMILGRAIYGSGVISLWFISILLIQDWFPIRDSNFAIGLFNFFPCLAVCLCSIIAPEIFQAQNPNWRKIGNPEIHGAGQSYFHGLYIQMFSSIATLVLISVDKYAEHNLERMKISWAKISSDKEATEVIEKEKPKFSWKDIKKLGRSYWYNVVSAGFQAIVNTVFILWIPLRYDTRYKWSHPSFAIAIVFLTQGILCPIIGLVIDKYGKLMHMTNAACVWLIIVFLFYLGIDYGAAEADDKDDEQLKKFNFEGAEIIPLVILGLQRAVFVMTSNSTIIKILVKEKIYGTASGFHYTLQYMALSGFPMIFAYYHQLDLGPGGQQISWEYYNTPTWIFFALSVCALIANMVLQIFDLKYKRGLLNKRDPYKFKEELVARKKGKNLEHHTKPEEAEKIHVSIQ